MAIDINVTILIDFTHNTSYRRVNKIQMQKYERGLSQLMHDDLHWLVIPQRVQYMLAVTVHHCL